MSNKNKVQAAPIMEVPETNEEVVNVNVVNDKPKAPKAKPAYIVYLTEQIATGEFTQKELYKLGCEKFPEVAKSTIQTVLVDCKNPKYNRLPNLVVKDDAGRLIFKR